MHILRHRLVAFQKFQFQTGSIKSRVLPAGLEIVLFRFNSKLVRLKGGCQCLIVSRGAAFQFQTGSIKSYGQEQ